MKETLCVKFETLSLTGTPMVVCRFAASGYGAPGSNAYNLIAIGELVHRQGGILIRVGTLSTVAETQWIPVNKIHSIYVQRENTI